MTQNPLSNIQQMVAALRQQNAATPTFHNYVPQLPNLNPNLQKDAYRVQLQAKGQAKPNTADWG